MCIGNGDILCFNTALFRHTSQALIQSEMITNVEKRSVIKFLVLRKIEPDEIIRQLSEAYSEQAPSRSTTYKWIKEFKCGRTNVVDDERCGRPCEIGDDKFEKLKKLKTKPANSMENTTPMLWKQPGKRDGSPMVRHCSYSMIMRPYTNLLWLGRLLSETISWSCHILRTAQISLQAIFSCSATLRNT